MRPGGAVDEAGISGLFAAAEHPGAVKAGGGSRRRREALKRLGDPAVGQRVMHAMMEMVKLDVAALEKVTGLGGWVRLVRGGKLALPDGRDFCLYALQAAIPLLPAKQRRNHPADWMETDAVCTCPDPACGILMRINRDRVTTFHHDDVSALPWAEVKAGQ